MVVQRVKATKPDACIYSDGIICEKHNGCISCGWNPAVNKARRRARRAWHTWVVQADDETGSPREVKGLVFHRKSGEIVGGLAEKSGKEA